MMQLYKLARIFCHHYLPIAIMLTIALFALVCYALGYGLMAIVHSGGQYATLKLLLLFGALCAVICALHRRDKKLETKQPPKEDECGTGIGRNENAGERVDGLNMADGRQNERPQISETD